MEPISIFWDHSVRWVTKSPFFNNSKKFFCPKASKLGSFVSMLRVGDAFSGYYCANYGCTKNTGLAAAAAAMPYSRICSCWCRASSSVLVSPTDCHLNGWGFLNGCLYGVIFGDGFLDLVFCRPRCLLVCITDQIFWSRKELSSSKMRLTLIIQTFQQYIDGRSVS